MYIGSTGPRGLHHLVYEVVDNSVDEALQGYCDHIVVTLHPDGGVTVVDNGRGIPVAVMADGRPARRRGGADQAARRRQVRRRRLQGLRRSARRRHLGGERAVRSSCWSRCAATATCGRRSTSAAIPQGPLARGESDRVTGTTITFLPDAEIFDETDFAFDTLAQRLREMAFLTRGLRLELLDERAGGQHADFRFEGGIRDFIAPRQRGQGAGAQGGHLLRERDRRGPGRGGHAVERQLRRVDVLVREQHQHPRGRHPPVRLQGRADAHAERLRPRSRAC